MLVLIEPNDLMFATLFLALVQLCGGTCMNYIDAEINPGPPKSRQIDNIVFILRKQNYNTSRTMDCDLVSCADYKQ